MAHTAHVWADGDVIDHGNLNNLETDLAALGDPYTDEQAQDAIAAMFAAGTLTGITFTYDDVNNKMNVTVTAAGVGDATTTAKGIIQLAGDLTGTAAAPALASIVTAATKGSATAIPVITYDAKGRITGVTTAAPSDTTRLAIANNLSDVASAATARTNLGLSTVAATGSYTDLSNKPTIPAAYTDEQAQDAAASLFSLGTMSGITFTYDDVNNKMNVTVTPGSVADATTTSKGAVQLAGDLTGTAAVPALIATGTAGTYGSASLIPVITTDSKGRVTGITTASVPVTSVAGRTGAVTLTKTDVGLANVDNTSDVNKPVSTAQQTALNLKANLASPTFTGTVSGITATMVGLGNVNNTSDASKPVSTAQQTALNAKVNGTVSLSVGTSSPVSPSINDLWVDTN